MSSAASTSAVGVGVVGAGIIFEEHAKAVAELRLLTSGDYPGTTGGNGNQ